MIKDYFIIPLGSITGKTTPLKKVLVKLKRNLSFMNVASHKKRKNKLCACPFLKIFAEKKK